MGGVKSTPGSWTYLKADEGEEWQFEVIGHEAEGLQPSDHVLAQVLFTAFGGIPIRDGEANARLMAAAPDLLAACELVLYRANADLQRVARGEPPIGFDFNLGPIKDAIGKASGEALP
jgi:hypothetical protein